MRESLTVTWNDGTVEKISCDSWVVRKGSDILSITVNYITRDYRYIPLSSIKEFRSD